MIPRLTERAFKLLACTSVGGCLVEFGVYQGASLVTIGKLAQKYLREVPPIYGFDSFEGMPSTTEPLRGALLQVYAEGAFKDTSLESVQERLKREGVRAKLVKGIFANLYPLMKYGIDNVRFAHVDADIYEGYRDALRLLTPHLQVGSVLLLDECIAPTDWRLQSIRDHGQRAVREWEGETGFNLHLVRFESAGPALCVIVDEEYLRRHWRVIEHLRRDSITESLENVVKLILRREPQLRRDLPV